MEPCQRTEEKAPDERGDGRWKRASTVHESAAGHVIRQPKPSDPQLGCREVRRRDWVHPACGAVPLSLGATAWDEERSDRGPGNRMEIGGIG